MIPVGVLSGFLGSGKTTRLKRMLCDPAFAKTAVIVNEFGAVGIDHDLLGVGEDQTILLSNGCVCCTARSGLEDALLNLWRRNAAGEMEIDRIVIETSGIADPVWVLQMLAPGGPFGGRFSRRQLVVIVDAGAGARTLQSSEAARRQVAFADRIKISKLDVFRPDPDLLACIRQLNPDAVIDVCEPNDLHADEFFKAADCAADFSDPCWTAGQMRHHDLHEGLRAFSILEDRPLQPPLPALFLEGLSRHCGERLLRVKGLIRLAGEPAFPLLVQGASYRRAEVTKLSAWPSADRRSRISIIARQVPDRWPELLFRALQAEVDALVEESVLSANRALQP